MNEYLSILFCRVFRIICGGRSGKFVDIFKEGKQILSNIHEIFVYFFLILFSFSLLWLFFMWLFLTWSFIIFLVFLIFLNIFLIFLNIYLVFHPIIFLLW